MAVGQKESARITSDMYIDKSVGKWIINGMEASEENDLGYNSSIESVSENALIVPPPNMDGKSEQQSTSYNFSRYKAV